jgi:hypothetical protein
MAKTKYGHHFLKPEVNVHRAGEDPTFRFSASGHGIDASWVLLPVNRLKPSAEDLPTHSHDFHQIITWFGANPRDISEFDAEEFTCLGAEQERHIVNTPTIQNLPPGTPHCPGGWLRVDKPVYHLDIFFAPEYRKKDVTVLDLPKKQTTGHKYDKHLIKAPIGPAKEGPPIKTLYFSAADYGVNATWIIVPILAPRTIEDKPHKHNFHQFFSFIGSNPRNLAEFDAEIEIYLGEEGEKHIITEPTVLHVTPGLMHNPMIYKKVGKPVIHLDIFFAPEYERIPASRKKEI